MPPSPRLFAALAACSLVPWLLGAALGGRFVALETRAGSALRLDLAGLVDGAELAFEGRVLATNVELDLHGRPCTRATLLVSRAFQGDGVGAVDVRLPGGVLPSGDGLLIPGMPSLVAGEEVVLFLSRESGAGLRVPVGLAQGKFRLVRDAAGGRTLVRDGADLALLDARSGELSHADAQASYDYAAFVAEVLAAVGARRGAPGGVPPPRAPGSERR